MAGSITPSNSVGKVNGVNSIIVTMTNWTPDLAQFSGPRYRAIADAVAADISAGTLPPGTRLPTHRDLAWRLGVTVGTVSRAYAEVERRGLVAGEIGRGTYVRAAGNASFPGLVWHEKPPPGFVDFSFNYAITGDEAAALAETVTRLAASPAFAELLHYHASAGRAADRTAGAAWIARSGLKAVPERVIVTNSAQHALAVIFTALTRPGDAVAVEYLTYPGMKALADLFGLRLVALAMDSEGLLPEAFDAACRGGQIKALYTMPTLHNPTTAVMPEERRRRVAEIARRHAVPIVEDDCFGFLLADPPPPLACFAPEQVFYVGSTAKSMAPGLRVGYVHAPSEAVDCLVRVMRATTYMASPLMAAVASSWIEDGIADRLVAAKRALLRERGQMIQSLAWVGRAQTHPASMHLFLMLPERWRADDFVPEARRRGVGLSPASVFAVSRNAAPNAVRLCFAAPSNTEAMERGLRTLAEMLAGAPAADLSVV